MAYLFILFTMSENVIESNPLSEILMESEKSKFGSI